MTQLLVSVTNVKEAYLALTHGADLIDLKDPASGALGALPDVVIKEVTAFVHAVSPRDTQRDAILVSATIGDLPMQADLIASRVSALAKTGVDIVKIGFFAAPDYAACLAALRPMTVGGKKIIAVLFAEYTYPVELLAQIKSAGFYGVMIDTAHKNGKTVLDYYTETQLYDFASLALSNDLFYGLAGSLHIQHVAKVLAFSPDFIGFRGGVSEGDQRERSLVSDKIEAIRKLL
jgi:uncharacterized protein (UPF0264 family)